MGFSMLLIVICALFSFLLLNNGDFSLCKAQLPHRFTDIFPGQVLLSSPYFTHVLNYQTGCGLHNIKTQGSVGYIVIVERLRSVWKIFYLQ